jgi:uncharacterized protein YegL
MRIVEAMLTCLILLVGLSVSVYIANVYSVMERGSVEETGTNIANVVEDLDVIEKLITHQDSGGSELKGIMANLLPPDTYYQLTIRSLLTGNTILEINNTAGSHNPSDYDLSTTERVVTISLPLNGSSYVPLDVMLITDISGSMGPPTTKLKNAQEAAILFVNQLNATRDKVGLVSFSDTAHLNSPLTNDFASVRSAINALTAGGYTDIGDGIGSATGEFSTDGRSSALWAMILLTDGQANRPVGINATQYALDKAKDAYVKGSNQKLRIYTIGLGSDVNEVLLKQIAQGPLNGITGLEGQYFYAPSAEDLQNIYLNIAKDLTFKVQYDMVVIELTLMKPR